MFRGIVEAKPFRSLIEFIRQIVSEVRVKVDHGGWLIEFIDPANITAGQVKLNSDNWGEYYLEDTMIFGLDLARLVDILPIFENYIQVEVAEYEIRLREGNITYTCALIDPEAIRRVKLRLDELYKQVRRGAFVVITYNLLRDLIRTATSEYLYLEASEDNIILFNGHLKVTTEEEYENILDYGIEEPTKAIYRIDYLKPLLKLKTDHFYIFFREKHPCYTTTEVGHFDVIYTVAPRIPDEEGYRAYAPKEVEFEYETEIDISRYKKGILQVKPNHIYIKGHKIYFMYYHRNAPVYHYTAVERDYPFVKEGLYSINDISDIIKPVDEITLGFTNDKLYINGIEVGSKVADELDIVEPDPTFEEIEIGAGDLKYLLRGLKHWDPLAIVCDNGELKLMSKPHEGEIREISVLGSCRGKGVIRALESWELLTPLGDVVRIYYKEDLNEPVIVVYIKQVKKPIREEIDMVYSVFLPSPEERELIDEVNEIFGVEVKEEKPPEKTDFEKLTEELRRYNPPYTYPPLDLRKKAEEFLENLLKEHGLDKYDRFYYYDRYIPSKERLIELLLMGWINGWDPREGITHVKPCEELSEKPPYFIDSWVVRYVPSDKVFQFSYTVNGLRGFPLYFDSLEEVNEFLEKGKGEVYIPQERETGIVEWKPARIPRLFKFKAGEVIDTPTATYTLEQPLVKSDNPDVWVWQVAVWDKVKHEDRREYLTEDEIEKLKSTFEEKPKHTPSLEDILAELEPLGYRERWRVIESLKAKGFEDVEETIDKFIKEGKLRKVGKYIEATKGVWEEYRRKLVEKVEEPKKGEAPFEGLDREKLIKKIERRIESIKKQIAKKRESYENLSQLPPTPRRAKMMESQLRDLGKLEEELKILEYILNKLEKGEPLEKEALWFLDKSLRGFLEAEVYRMKSGSEWGKPIKGAFVYMWLAEALLDHVSLEPRLRQILKRVVEEGGMEVPLEVAEEILAKVKELPAEVQKDEKYYIEYLKKDINLLKALRRFGLELPSTFKSAVESYASWKERILSGTPSLAEELETKKKEKELLLEKIPGFIPTPKEVARHMVELAPPFEGARVLEPSAGAGNIAEVIRDYAREHGINIKLDVCEIHSKLREILKAKGFDLVCSDFLRYNPGQIYDRIYMNPPFEQLQDVEHVKHAYELLKPGGYLVAITSPGWTFREDRKAKEFREWVKDKLVHQEDLPEGVFKEYGTGVRAKIIVLHKPEAKKPEVKGEVKESVEEEERKTKLPSKLFESKVDDPLKFALHDVEQLGVGLTWDEYRDLDIESYINELNKILGGRITHGRVGAYTNYYIVGEGKELANVTVSDGKIIGVYIVLYGIDRETAHYRIAVNGGKRKFLTFPDIKKLYEFYNGKNIIQLAIQAIEKYTKLKKVWVGKLFAVFEYKGTGERVFIYLPQLLSFFGKRNEITVYKEVDWNHWKRIFFPHTEKLEELKIVEKLLKKEGEKPSVEEKPKEEKPPAKPPAEPYNFILEKLKSTFLAELELAGLSEEEAERELEAIMFEIEKLAKDVVEGKLSQVDAVKEVIKKARTITRPTEVAPPEELKIVKEEKPRRIRRAEEIWKERKVEYAPPTEVRSPELIAEDVIRRYLPELLLFGADYVLRKHGGELGLVRGYEDYVKRLLTKMLSELGEKMIRTATRGVQYLAGKLIAEQAHNIVAGGIREGMKYGWDDIRTFIRMNYPDILVKYGGKDLQLIIMGWAMKELGVPHVAMPEDIRRALRHFEMLEG